ncbi:hypothetical protein ACWTV9_05545 [Clostridioides difficile]
MACIDIGIKVDGLDCFVEEILLLGDILLDERICIEIRQEYERKLSEIVDKYE